MVGISSHALPKPFVALARRPYPRQNFGNSDKAFHTLPKSVVALITVAKSTQVRVHTTKHTLVVILLVVVVVLEVVVEFVVVVVVAVQVIAVKVIVVQVVVVVM